LEEFHNDEFDPFVLFCCSFISSNQESQHTLPCRLGNSKPFDTLADLGSCVNIITIYLFNKLNIRLLEETVHIFGLADGTKSYPVGIVKDVEVHIGKLKLLNDFYVIDMKKDPETPLLVGRGFLATANAVIDYRMAKIAVEEGITRSIFAIKGDDLGEDEAPYWTTLGKRESYKPRPHSDGVGTQTPYYARKDFLDYHLPREWEIATDVVLNPFKDTLVFRRMVFSTWMSFRGNTCDLSSFEKETDKITDLHQDSPRSIVLKAWRWRRKHKATPSALDMTTLRELIGLDRRLIPEVPVPGTPRVVMPTPHVIFKGFI
nr:hypothetical protein [Tanacetum cinerariifolium]